MSRALFRGMNLTKAYNISAVGDDAAEITMYGEVVATRPVDWWTGEPIPGNFIVVDEFLADLESIKDKSDITVHINSVGGDLYGGLSIYNRLKGLKGHVTTIVDGLAASAASLIFQAGNTRKVNSGSNVMIHGASSFLYGFYNVQDLMSGKKTLEAHNKAAINAYVESTGRSADEIKSLMEKTTWFAGQEAVDASFADEVISTGDPVVMSMSPDRAYLMVNGVAMSARSLGNIPQGIPVSNTLASAATPQVALNKNNGGSKMEIKNVDELRTAYPEFVAQIEASVKAVAHAEGAASERARIQGIEEIQNAIGNTDLIRDAKFGEQVMTAEQLAFKAMQAQASIGASVLNSLSEDAKTSGANNVSAAPNSGIESGADDKAEEAAAINMIVGNRKKEGN
ncbi:Clp protease ClpP [Paenibacillus alvei]|uniref:ATP-dependent Clp protease proteolytic subunit n=1 Tax=Paenibacillus alvei TaxID=44250 RepID=A0ABT4H0B0_PAEAL|nr:head maturation protease, ClpP-related [Paenibacillus alvei]EJW19153.1 ATP-dependent Clp protease, protease subunit [Paenibacillus alvei DSM 29]MCY9541845.1 Clp protease ClpP [Paenibacillus alvei]MCY9706319.1 Clp protease ClpP [Paenibacillus alvei]MCY9732245.1 Clp protease ClpP [Paenibacillus alvei]MCY9756029.1 Clp protease ClpP [Paenibacillus alvei]